MNPVYALFSAAYIFAIFFLADSGAASQIGEFNPYSLLHVPLYGGLTLLVLLSLGTGKGKYTPERLVAGAIIAGIVGALDEFHQTFIPTREGTWGDVFLDLLGVIIAILVFRRFFPFLQRKFGPVSGKSGF
jgi:VanZ family protein